MTKPDSTPRSQFHHINDVVPTIYDILNIKAPKVVNGFEQMPLDGVSFKYTFNDAVKQKKYPRFSFLIIMEVEEFIKMVGTLVLWRFPIRGFLLRKV